MVIEFLLVKDSIGALTKMFVEEILLAKTITTCNKSNKTIKCNTVEPIKIKEARLNEKRDLIFNNK